MKKKVRVNRFIEYFSKNLPEAKTELEYNNAFELTVAVVLSAQCTDKRVNIITKNLFKKMPTAEIMASSTVDEIFTLIKSCSYPRNKAKHLFGLSNMLINDFNAKIPNNSKDLQKLPGVGRKTANVVASVYFDIPSMPVDTQKTPLDCEMQLLKIIPRDFLNIAHHWLILHGRYTCKARNPDCDVCGVSSSCKFFDKKKFC